jgi:hypothetical protein
MKDEISVRMERVSQCRGLMSMRGGDFVPIADSGHSFCVAMVGGGGISGTAVGRESHKRIPSARDVRPTATNRSSITSPSATTRAAWKPLNSIDRVGNCIEDLHLSEPLFQGFTQYVTDRDMHFLNSGSDRWRLA